MVASFYDTSLFGTRLIVGFGGFGIEPPLLLLVLRAFGPEDYHFHMSAAYSLLGVHSSHQLPLMVMCNFISHVISGIIHCHNIKLLFLDLAPPGINSTYDPGVFSLGVDITMAGCHKLTQVIFYNHTGCLQLTWLHIVSLSMVF